MAERDDALREAIAAVDLQHTHSVLIGSPWQFAHGWNGALNVVKAKLEALRPRSAAPAPEASAPPRYECRVCKFYVRRDDPRLENWKNAVHRNARGEADSNKGTLYCPLCEDETLVELAAPPAASATLLDLLKAITHCENCGHDWLDNGLNPPRCPYCSSGETPEMDAGYASHDWEKTDDQIRCCRCGIDAGEPGANDSCYFSDRCDCRNHQNQVCDQCQVGSGLDAASALAPARTVAPSPLPAREVASTQKCYGDADEGCSGRGRPTCTATECMYGAEPCSVCGHFKAIGAPCGTMHAAPAAAPSPDAAQLLQDLETAACGLDAVQRNASARTVRKAMAVAREHHDAYTYLARLFVTVWPQCRPQNSLLHLCTQIDNGIAGLLKPVPPAAWTRERPKIICLCGSTRFIEHFAIKTWELELEGHIVLGCTLLPSWYCPVRDHFAETLGVKEQRDNHHLQKIDLADEVLVLNIGGYIGESTRNEIAYATSHGKVVNYLEPLPAPPARDGKEPR